jgi:protein BCP1
MPPLRSKPAGGKRSLQEAEDSEPEVSDSQDVSSDGSDSSFPDVSDEEEEGGSDDEDDDGADVKEITVEFEFSAPEEKDFLGLKALLSSYLNGEQFDSSGFIDAVISEVG